MAYCMVPMLGLVCSQRNVKLFEPKGGVQHGGGLFEGRDHLARRDDAV